MLPGQGGGVDTERLPERAEGHASEINPTIRIKRSVVDQVQAVLALQQLHNVSEERSTNVKNLCLSKERDQGALQ